MTRAKRLVLMVVFVSAAFAGWGVPARADERAPWRIGNPCRKRSHLLVENGPARVMTSAGSRRGRSCLTSLD